MQRDIPESASHSHFCLFSLLLIGTLLIIVTCLVVPAPVSERVKNPCTIVCELQGIPWRTSVRMVLLAAIC